MFEGEDGIMRTIDLKPMLAEHMGDFTSLREERVFQNFYVSEVGILTWDVDLPKTSENQINQFDIAPEYIYENSRPLVITQGEYRIPVAHI
jgi:hypothetical protein